MPVVGLRDLSRKTREVVEQLEQDGDPVVITRRGRPIAMLKSVAEEETAALALAAVPEQLAVRDHAAEEIEAGKGEPATALLAELEAEDEEVEEVEIEIPTSLTRQLVDTVIEGRADDISSRERAILDEYVSALVENSILSTLQRARSVTSQLTMDPDAELVTKVAHFNLGRVRRLSAAELTERLQAQLEEVEEVE